MAIHPVEERRSRARVGFRGRVEIDLLASPDVWQHNTLQSQERFEADSVNLSEGGLCVRLEQTLDIHTRVALRVFADSRKRPVECVGRVAWVVQRLDLRDVPPFLYDIGLEFVDPPLRLRQLTSRTGPLEKPSSARSTTKMLYPHTIKDRCYIPRLEQDSSSRSRWHLIVTVDSAPCFSCRYATEREALSGWEQFKRQST